MIVFTFLICLVNLNIGPFSNGNVDNYGHYGGVITGILMGMTFAENYDLEARQAKRTPDRFSEEQYKFRKRICCDNFIFNYLGHYLLTLYIVGGLIYFYTSVDVDNIKQDHVEGVN